MCSWTDRIRQLGYLAMRRYDQWSWRVGVPLWETGAADPAQASIPGQRPGAKRRRTTSRGGDWLLLFVTQRVTANTTERKLMQRSWQNPSNLKSFRCAPPHSWRLEGTKLRKKLIWLWPCVHRLVGRPVAAARPHPSRVCQAQAKAEQEKDKESGQEACQGRGLRERAN